MEELIVDGNSCNDKTFTELDFSSFVNLKLFEVGDYSFAYVKGVKLIGLHALKRVLIGKHCFRNGSIYDPNHHFYLKDCEKLKELKIGRYSFFGYSFLTIENTNSLEVIEMGKLDEWSWNFCFASLELKSDGDGMK